jgi:2-polyprenyl-3-methyl-5-hydroxy-6-metoxy-1,4-benzoquinol methylase
MTNNTPTEDGVVIGNVYPKYSTKNPIAKILFNGFLKAVDQLIDQVDSSKIHEVGCGEGYLLSRFVDGKRILVGSDFSKQVIEEARHLSIDTGITFKAISLYELTPIDDSAPLILCCEVLEHLEFPEKAVDILADIADPYLIASVPREPIWRILNILRGQYLKDFGNTPGHLNHWSKTNFLRLLGRRFEIVQIRTPLPWTMALCRKIK